MLSSMLPWEWILESILDLKEFSSPCLKELISNIPHIEDPRCSKLLQKVALRYLEEIVLTRKVDPCAITLIKYILKAQGSSSLLRIHSLKESVENDLVLRVETEVVLATVRYPCRSGDRNWEAFEDALEEVFPESSRETLKVERRKELNSILLVDEHQDDLCERVLRKYPLEELLKDLLQFIGSKRTLLKTKFLDQLAKDVQKGSYIPSSTSPLSEKGLPSPKHVSKDCHSNPEVPEIRLRRDKADSSYPSQTGPTLPNTLLGEPIERLTTAMKETSADAETNRSSPSSPISLVDGGQTTRHDVKEQSNLAGEKSTGAGKVSVQEELMLDMSPSMADVDKVARELTSQMNEFVDNMDKFAADIHKVAVNSTEQSFALVNTVVSQEEQRVDPASFLAEFDVALKRSATDQLPESARKSKRGCLDDSPGTGRDIDGGFPVKAGFSVRNDHTTGPTVDESIELDCSASGSGLKIPNETSLYRRLKAFLRQSTQEQHVPRPSAPTGTILKHGSCGHGACALCQRAGVLLSCHGCSVIVHERCLEEIDMGKAVDDPSWLCPSCVEQLTLEVLQTVKAEAEIARQKAAAFVRARGKHLGERHSSSKSVDELDPMTNSSRAFLAREESARSKDSKDQAPRLQRDRNSSAQDETEASQARAMKTVKGCLYPPTSQVGGKRYSLRPRAIPSAREENNYVLDERKDLTRTKLITAPEVDAPEPLLIPSSPVAASNADRSTPNVATPETGRSTPAVEEVSPTSMPSRGRVENDGHANLTDLISPEKGQGASVRCGASKQNLPSSGEPTPAKDPQLNIPKPVVEEGDGHDGDLEEDINRHQDGVDSSKENQTSDHPSPVGERTPHRKGPYRGRWKIPGVRRKNLPWTKSEVAVLREGVEKYSSSGFGFQWKNILEFGYGKFDPSRTTVDLKDKWRNLSKFQDRSSSSDVSV